MFISLTVGIRGRRALPRCRQPEATAGINIMVMRFIVETENICAFMAVFYSFGMSHEDKAAKPPAKIHKYFMRYL